MSATYRPHPWNNTLNRVWEIATLSWVVMTQPGGGGGGGDASAANQVTGNASLAAIKTDVDKIPALGQALAAASTPVVLTAIQVTALTPPAAIAGFALEAGHLAAIDTSVAKIPSQGQALAAASVPVVLTAIQVAALTPVANATVNVAQMAGVAPSLNTGVRDAGTQRVTIATNDSVPVTNVTATNLNAAVVGTGTAGTPAGNILTIQGVAAMTKLLVTPDSVALPANQSTNVAQLAGTATSVNSGVKDAGTLRVIIATDQPALTNKLLVTPDSVALPANQSVNINQIAGVTPVLNTGVRAAGVLRVTVATDDLVPVSGTVTVTPPTLTKGTQGATGFSTQDLKDAGRNQTNYFMAAPIITTTAEVMQSMTGYKGGIAVAATVTPAVVTTAKTYRINQVIITYWAATVIGGARINLRANLSGTGVVTSPLVASWQVGMPAIFTAGAAETYTFSFPDGLEFAAGTGIAFGVIGEGAVPTTGTITGYVMITVHGYEY